MNAARQLAALALSAGTALLQDPVPDPPTWTWTDFEVVGQRSQAREVILADPPIEIGTLYAVDRQRWTAWGEAVRERLDLAAVHVGAVRFMDFKAYLVVDIIEHGDEHRLEEREAPGEDLDLGDEALRDAFARLEARGQALFELGTPPREELVDGALDYADPEMHTIVEELRRLVPPRRESLLAVLARSADEGERADAATLLHWAGDPLGSVAETHALLDDPSGSVRNNLTRFLLFHVDRVEDADLRRDLVRTFARQVERPSHGDRNKGLYALLHLAEAFPGDRAAMREIAGEPIARIAGQSVLSNVRGPAEELLELLAESPR